MDFTECSHCSTRTEEGYWLCPVCELALAMTLLRLSAWLDPLHASLDATMHPGGHQPTRTITPTAPTPIRLNVLDLLDLIDANTRALWRRLEGVDALDWRNDKPANPGLGVLLIDTASHPRLALISDAGMWFDTFARLERQTLAIIDVPDDPKPIGHCPNPLCGIQLKATDSQTTVTCPMCGKTWDVTYIRINLLKSLAVSNHLFTLTECAELLRQCGYQITRKQLQNRRDRGKLTSQTNGNRRSQLFRIRDVIASLRVGFDKNQK